MRRVDCKPMVVGIQHRGSTHFVDQWHDAVGLFHLSFGERGRRVRHVLTRPWLRRVFRVGPYRDLSCQHQVTEIVSMEVARSCQSENARLHWNIDLPCSTKYYSASAYVEHSSRPEVLSMARGRRRDFFCCTLLLLVWLAVWIPRLTGPINLRWDASAYYILGTALAEGKGYRLLNEPGEIHAVQYRG
jgi:hypothetical protein